MPTTVLPIPSPHQLSGENHWLRSRHSADQKGTGLTCCKAPVCSCPLDNSLLPPLAPCNSILPRPLSPHSKPKSAVLGSKNTFPTPKTAEGLRLFSEGKNSWHFRGNFNKRANSQHEDTLLGSSTCSFRSECFQSRIHERAMIRYAPAWGGKQLTFFGIVLEWILVKITPGSFGLVPDTWKIDFMCQPRADALSSRSSSPGWFIAEAPTACSLGLRT